jgi:hypothetical protein
LQLSKEFLRERCQEGTDIPLRNIRYKDSSRYEQLKLRRDSAKRAQEADFFQVLKLGGDNIFRSADKTQRYRAHRRNFKGEAFETFEIFQVREESEILRGGEIVVFGSRTVKNLDH